MVTLSPASDLQMGKPPPTDLETLAVMVKLLLCNRLALGERKLFAS